MGEHKHEIVMNKHPRRAKLDLNTRSENSLRAVSESAIKNDMSLISIVFYYISVYMYMFIYLKNHKPLKVENIVNN